MKIAKNPQVLHVLKLPLDDGDVRCEEPFSIAKMGLFGSISIPIKVSAASCCGMLRSSVWSNGHCIAYSKKSAAMSFPSSFMIP